jgi:hypothetical protein
MANYIKLVSWWQWVIFINIVLIFLTAIDKFAPYFSFKSRIASPFNLLDEMNLAVWWSTILLFTLFWFSFQLFAISKDKTKLSWLILSFIFVGLSFDEIGSVHERLGSGGFSAFIPYASVIVGLLSYSMTILYRRESTKQSVLFIFIGFMMYSFVAIMEYIGNTNILPLWLSEPRSVVEEGFELFGTFIILLGLVRQYQSKVSHSSLDLVNIANIVNFIPILLCVGLVINIIICLMILPSLNDLEHRGNPAVWYPVILNFILFVELLRTYLLETSKKKIFLIIASIVFLISSAYIIFPLYIYIPFISRLIPTGILKGFYLVYIGQFALACIIIKINDGFSKIPMLFSGALFLLFLIGLFQKIDNLKYLNLSVFTFVLASYVLFIFLPNIGKREPQLQMFNQ